MAGIINAGYELVSVTKLTEHPDNPRRGDLDAITASIEAHGFYGAIVAQRSTGRILAGNHRYRAAKQAGAAELPVVWVDVDDTTARRILAADNRTSDLGTYDDELLAVLLGQLAETEAGLLGTGYTDGDLSELLASINRAATGPTLTDPDEVPDAPASPITKPGDLWQLGPHRVLCGDCRSFEDVRRLVGHHQVNVAFTSPPYASQREYDPSSGFAPIRPDEYVDWFEDVQANMRAVLAEDGSWFVNIKEHCEDGQRHLYVKDLTLAHVRRWGWLFVDELCWLDLANGMPGSWPNRFKDAWEPVFHYAAQREIKFRPDAVATPSENVPQFSPERWRGLTRDGYVERAPMDYKPGMALPSNVVKLRAGGYSEHSAAFPVGLPAWFIQAYSDPGDLILDPFLGSGTSIIAAEQEGRIGYGLEISPRYVDVICRRFQQHTGKLPVLVSTGQEVDFDRESPPEEAQAGT